MGFTVPTATAPVDQVEAARRRDDALGYARPLIVIALTCLAMIGSAWLGALLGPIRPVDAHSTGAPTVQLAPAVTPVDMRPPDAVPLPLITTPVRR